MTLEQYNKAKPIAQTLENLKAERLNLESVSRVVVQVRNTDYRNLYDIIVAEDGSKNSITDDSGLRIATQDFLISLRENLNAAIKDLEAELASL